MNPICISFVVNDVQEVCFSMVPSLFHPLHLIYKVLISTINLLWGLVKLNELFVSIKRWSNFLVFKYLKD